MAERPRTLYKLKPIPITPQYNKTADHLIDGLVILANKNQPILSNGLILCKQLIIMKTCLSVL